jgi:peroxiredoxin
MAATPSTMLPLGTTAPDFTLTDTVSGKPITLSTFRAGRPALVMFICNHCPFVKHIRAQLASIGRDYGPRAGSPGRIAILAISSNDPDNYPDDAPDRMREEAASAGYTFPYLFDSTQEVAKSYRAACTPDFFLFDAAGQLAYRGQLDDSRPSNTLPVTGRDLRAAIDAVLAGGSPILQQRPSLGCNIKWKPGNEPDYAS